MLEDGVWWLNYNQYEDLRVYEIGVQNCGPCYEVGPTVREHFILHYVYEGCGELIINNKSFKVKKNQFFFLPPGQLVQYKSDETNPWHYIWAIIDGYKVSDFFRRINLTKNNPVYVPKEENDIFKEMFFRIANVKDREFECIGTMYKIFQSMSDFAKEKKDISESIEPALQYVKTAIDYIEIKYCEPITVKSIADYCGIDRAYMSKIFKHAIGETLQEYLIKFRVKKAKQFLKETDFSVQYIGYSVGYNDPFTFSKVFKKHTGVSPRGYRMQKL